MRFISRLRVPYLRTVWCGLLVGWRCLTCRLCDAVHESVEGAVADTLVVKPDNVCRQDAAFGPLPESVWHRVEVNDVLGVRQYGALWVSWNWTSIKPFESSFFGSTPFLQHWYICILQLLSFHLTNCEVCEFTKAILCTQKATDCFLTWVRCGRQQRNRCLALHKQTSYQKLAAPALVKLELRTVRITGLH